MKPPKWKAGDDAWQKLVDFWARPERIAQSQRNSKNRAKNKVTTHHGSKSFAQGRHEFFIKEKHHEDLVETWWRTHTDKDNVFQTKENERLYGEMKAIKDAIKEKKMDYKTDRQIIEEVLDSHNRGHIAGVGRVVPGTGSSSRSSQADQGFCTREEVEEMKKAHAMELEEQRNLFKQFLDFYNRQQGTPASQFHIPDSSTPMFPGSTYTRGGPSTTHSDPSSDLDLDNCYIPTSVDEDGAGNSEHDNVGDGGSSSEFDDDE